MISYASVGKFYCEDIRLIDNYDKAISDSKMWKKKMVVSAVQSTKNYHLCILSVVYYLHLTLAVAPPLYFNVRII